MRVRRIDISKGTVIYVENSLRAQHLVMNICHDSFVEGERTQIVMDVPRKQVCELVAALMNELRRSK